jgi:hypothetical protein
MVAVVDPVAVAAGVPGAVGGVVSGGAVEVVTTSCGAWAASSRLASDSAVELVVRSTKL